MANGKRSNYIKQKHPKPIQQQLNFMSDVIDKFVDYGDVFIDGLDEKGYELGNDYPIYTMIYQFLDVLDSISILTRKGSTVSVKILSRTLLELSMNLRYILVMPKEKGKASYNVCYLERLKAKSKISDENTKAGQNFEANLRKLNQNSKRYGLIISPIISERNNSDNDDLYETYPHLKIAKDEYDKVRKKLNKNNPYNNLEPNWYSLFNGPNSFRKLLEKFDLAAYYEILYGPQSGELHGSEANAMMQSSDNGIGITMLRNPEHLQNAIFGVLDITHRLYDFIAESYITENRKKEYYNWYNETIKDKHKKIKHEPLYFINHAYRK
ncbi:DUF5677 domain-containing protein [Rummeliibacillus pycnus]|uniref:DUF5677 domain-containing protein n=1 Tax=Rummeliibacillus pycnus TaxID=101070 RepID=UPI003D2E0917